MQELQEFRSVGSEDPLEEGMAAHSNILAWRIPWTEEAGRLQSVGLQRVGHDWSDLSYLLKHSSTSEAWTVLGIRSINLRLVSIFRKKTTSCFLGPWRPSAVLGCSQGLSPQGLISGVRGLSPFLQAWEPRAPFSAELPVVPSPASDSGDMGHLLRVGWTESLSPNPYMGFSKGPMLSMCSVLVRELPPSESTTCQAPCWGCRLEVTGCDAPRASPRWTQGLSISVATVSGTAARLLSVCVPTAAKGC